MEIWNEHLSKNPVAAWKRHKRYGNMSVVYSNGAQGMMSSAGFTKSELLRQQTDSPAFLQLMAQHQQALLQLL